MKYLKDYNLFEATYYKDDLNVHLTSVVSDIFEDLTDDSDFEVNCFTIGYENLKDVGATYTENDIHFSITREYYEYDLNENYKTFTLDEIMPYLKRTIEYMESEGKPSKNIYYQYNIIGEIGLSRKRLTVNELLNGGDFQIDSLNITFGYK
jgi:hypothetical protein